MKPVNSNARDFTSAAVLCVLGSALLSVSAPAAAASKTLTISGTPAATVMVSGKYSFQPIGKDTVKSRIKFDIYNKPSWATFDGTTGRLSGQPNRNQVGTYGGISIRLTDWYGYVTTPTFSIRVTSAPAVPTNTPPTTNTAPTISGKAPTAVNSGTAYSFTPKAADVNNDTLSFSIQNKPDWANFNTASGTLSGVPEAGDVGTYANIRISASDGKASVALPVFTVAVNQMSAGNVTLDWTPPTENTDATVLTNLAGYNLHYGTSPTALTQSIKITNAGLTSYVVDNLSPGKWYFAMTSYTTNGMESSDSGVVSTTIL